MSRYIPRTKMTNGAEVPNSLSVYFHRNNLLTIQRALGAKNTFLSHITYPKHELVPVLNEKGKAKKGMFKRVEKGTQHGIVAKFGKAKPVLAMLNGTPNDIKGEYYVQLKKDLADAASKRGLL